MIKASCCCGAVRFELLAKPSMMGTCHCTRCRKLGASTLVFVRKDDPKWIEGKDNIQRFKPTAPYKYTRCFCRTCGSSLGEILSAEDSFPIPANLLDSDPGIKNRFHEFVSDKPDWLEIGDGAPQYQEHPEPA